MERHARSRIAAFRDDLTTAAKPPMGDKPATLTRGAVR